MTKTYTIYRHINKINGKSYIGQTCQKVEARWKNGQGYKKKHQTAFYNAIQKYGWDNFEHEILVENIKTLEESNRQEQYWIAYYHTWVYDPKCNGYNQTKGGDGSPGRKVSEQTKTKIKKAVYCVELDQIFDSMTSASETTGCLVSKISLCCKGLANTAGGYHWRYIDENLAKKATETLNSRINKKQKYYDSLGTPVYCIVQGKKISFSSRSAAARWWFENYQPFGPVFHRNTYIKKINQAIEGKSIFTGTNQYGLTEIVNIKWFLEEE